MRNQQEKTDRNREYWKNRNIIPGGDEIEGADGL